MGQRGDGLVEVVLVEDGEDVSEGVERATGPSLGRQLTGWWSSRPARLRSGVARFGATVAAVTCVAVVVQQGTVAADEAAIAALPGKSVALAAPLREAWHFYDVYPLGRVDGDLVLSGGSESVTRRIDSSTGAVRWSVPTGGWCQPLDTLLWGAYSGGVVQQLDGVRLLCASTNDLWSGDASDQGGSIVLLDVDDGTTSPGPVLDGGLLGMIPVEGDVVVATATADGRVLAERWSPESGSTLWSYAGTEPIIDRLGGYGVSSGPGTLQVDGSRTLLLDLATGLEISSADDASSSYGHQTDVTTESSLSDGSTVRGSIGDTWSFERTAADGTGLPPFPGWPVAVRVDDGSGAGTAFALTPDGTMAAVDLGTGSARWTLPGYDVVAVLDGLIVVLDNASLSAHDVETGAEVWTEPISQDQFGGTAVTDGRSVGYLAVPDPGTAQAGSGLVLRVVDLRTGVERSQTPIAGYSARLLGTAPDGTILVLTMEGRLSGLRP